MAQSAYAANITNQGVKRSGITRTIFRWIHIVFSIPILGYIYSPFEKLPDYAFKTRFVFVPIMVLSGLWMWKGHVVRRLNFEKIDPTGFSWFRCRAAGTWNKPTFSGVAIHEPNESQGRWAFEKSQEVAGRI